MADIVDQAIRSRMMSRINSKNTKPEIALRKSLHRRGLRYRLHVDTLPGRPDIVLGRRRIAIFVHGCFWHRHDGCSRSSTPASNLDFWREKFQRNVERDRQTRNALHKAGWRVAVTWECGLRPAGLENTVSELIKWIDSGFGDFESTAFLRRPSKRAVTSPC